MCRFEIGPSGTDCAPHVRGKQATIRALCANVSAEVPRGEAGDLKPPGRLPIGR